MGIKQKANLFKQTLIENNSTHAFYLERLTDIALTCFKWENMPDSVDTRYLELCLFENGKAIFFEDEILKEYLALSLGSVNGFDVYGYPVKRKAYSRFNHYQSRELTDKDSVIIYNNYVRTPGYEVAQGYAYRLWFIDRVIDLNLNAQKTPLLIQGTEQQRQTLINLYKEYDGNQPFIFGDKNLDMDSLKAILTGAPFIADKVLTIKQKLWNEACEFMGVSAARGVENKRERVTATEIQQGTSIADANRNSRLYARQQAADKINKMFGLDVKVDFASKTDIDLNLLNMPSSDNMGGGDNE